jgi:prephenate dehydrogenase
MNVTVIGLGLIGGSIASDLRKQMGIKVSGVDANREHAEQALTLKLVDQIETFEEGVKKADIVILAIPVDNIEKILPKVLDTINIKATVIDVGSTKRGICASVSNHKYRGRFVASHPLAGTEFSGPQAAVKNLFLDKKNIICEAEKSDQDAMCVAISLFESLGAQTTFMSPDDHDRHLAYVSHLSHVSSFMLGKTVLDIEQDEKQIFELAGTGFESTVRLAKSNPKTWSAIFSKNKEFLLEALDSYIEHLQTFRSHIHENNINKLETLMQESNAIKRVLNKK